MSSKISFFFNDMSYIFYIDPQDVYKTPSSQDNIKMLHAHDLLRIDFKSFKYYSFGLQVDYL